MNKEFTIAVYHRGRRSDVTGTLAYLIDYFGYKLECGHSYNHRIPLRPKTIKSLVSALNKSALETQGGCYDYDSYELIPVLTLQY